MWPVIGWYGVNVGTLGGVCIGFSQPPPDIPAVTGFLLCTKERECCKVSQGCHVSSVLLCDKLPGRL